MGLLEPVHVGDEITGTTRLADLDQKRKKGPFVRLVRETTFTNQDEQIVARSRQVGIAMSQYPTINNVQVGDELPVMRKSAQRLSLSLQRCKL